MADDANLARQRREKETTEKSRVIQEEKLKIDNQIEIDRRKALEARNAEIGKIDVKAKEREKEESEEKATILAEIGKIEEDAQRRVAKAESDLRLLKIDLKRKRPVTTVCTTSQASEIIT